MVEFAPQIGQGLRVGGIGPQGAGHPLPGLRPAGVHDQQGQQRQRLRRIRANFTVRVVGDHLLARAGRRSASGPRSSANHGRPLIGSRVPLLAQEVRAAARVREQPKYHRVNGSTGCTTLWADDSDRSSVENVGSVLDELQWRGLVAESTDEAALREHLDAGPVTFYVGFDPTAPSLHFGNLVQLIVARASAARRPPAAAAGRRLDRHDRRPEGLRRAGAEQHRGRRRLGGPDPRARWSGTSTSTAPTAARIVNNLDWTGPMPVLDFLRDIGKHFPVNRMLARDVVRNRLEDGHLLHRVLLRAAAVDGLPRAVPQLRLHAAVRRQRPVGQHHRRRRADPAVRRRPGARPGHAAADQGGRDASSARPSAARSGWTRR